MIRESLEEEKKVEGKSILYRALQKETLAKIYERLIWNNKLNLRYQLYREIDMSVRVKYNPVSSGMLFTKSGREKECVK